MVVEQFRTGHADFPQGRDQPLPAFGPGFYPNVQILRRAGVAVKHHRKFAHEQVTHTLRVEAAQEIRHVIVTEIHVEGGGLAGLAW